MTAAVKDKLDVQVCTGTDFDGGAISIAEKQTGIKKGRTYPRMTQ